MIGAIDKRMRTQRAFEHRIDIPWIWHRNNQPTVLAKHGGAISHELPRCIDMLKDLAGDDQVELLVQGLLGEVRCNDVEPSLGQFSGFRLEQIDAETRCRGMREMTMQPVWIFVGLEKMLHHAD